MCFSFLLLALVSAGRMFFLYTPGSDPSRVYYGTDTMAFPILLGMFLGAVRQAYPRLRLPNSKTGLRPIFSLFVLLLGILFFTIDGRLPFLYQGGMFLISLLFTVMLHIMENLKYKQQISQTHLLSLLGKKSYGIYLWHYPIMVLALI